MRSHPCINLIAIWASRLMMCFVFLQQQSIAEEERLFSFSEAHMGTIFRIDVYSQDAQKVQQAAQLAFQEIAAINQVASDYLPDSEITRFNHTPANTPFRASPFFYELVEKSIELHQKTYGAFDITADYSIQAWRRSKRLKRLPTQSEIDRAISLTNIEALKLDENSRTITKTVVGLRINLGGIGKGFAADKALSILKQQGLPRAIVAGSGDIAIGQAPPIAKGWRVKLHGFVSPDDDRVIFLENVGVSTSGDTQQFFELNGKIHSHIIDPKTGLGLTNRVICTVIAPNATTSDSFDNAMCVLGVSDGIRVLQQEKLEGRFIQHREGMSSLETLTPQFPVIPKSSAP